MLFARCGKLANRSERSHGRAEQSNQDTATCSQWRPPRLPAGVRLCAATESCNNLSI
jgi:hypothetical protein